MDKITEVKNTLGSCYDVLEKNGHPRKNGNYPCPFHEDKNPSFSVYQNGEKFKCFSCGIQGDSIDLQTLFDGRSPLKELFVKKGELIKQSPEIAYLVDRGIRYAAVEDFLLLSAGFVGINIRNADLEIVGQQRRSIREKKFSISKGGNTGVFFENQKSGGVDLFVVEGLFDFLTIRQATPHVLGYVSATSHCIDVSKIISGYRNIYWLGDQDEAGKRLKQKFLETCKDVNIYEMPKTDLDANDLLSDCPREEIIQNIKELCSLTFEGKITVAQDHIADIVSDLKSSKIDFTWGTRARDLVLGILHKGQYNVLVGEAGAGKTEFSFYLARENAQRGHKILYFGLEMTTKGLLKRYARKKSGITREEQLDGVPEHKIAKAQNVLKNIPENIEFWGGEGITVAEINEKLSQRKYDMIFIDNFGFIEEDQQSDDKYQEISRQLVNLKKKNNTCIIAIHHFRKDSGRKGIRSLQDMRGSAKIGDDVDLAIHYCRPFEPETQEEKHSCMVRILKDRDEGEIAEFQMYFKAGTFVDDYEI